jgi:hypothetical protein
MEDYYFKVRSLLKAHLNDFRLLRQYCNDNGYDTKTVEDITAHANEFASLLEQVAAAHKKCLSLHRCVNRGRVIVEELQKYPQPQPKSEKEADSSNAESPPDSDSSSTGLGGEDEIDYFAAPFGNSEPKVTDESGGPLPDPKKEVSLSEDDSRDITSQVSGLGRDVEEDFGYPSENTSSDEKAPDESGSPSLEPEDEGSLANLQDAGEADSPNAESTPDSDSSRTGSGGEDEVDYFAAPFGNSEPKVTDESGSPLPEQDVTDESGSPSLEPEEEGSLANLQDAGEADSSNAESPSDSDSSSTGSGGEDENEADSPNAESTQDSNSSNTGLGGEDEIDYLAALFGNSEPKVTDESGSPSSEQGGHTPDESGSPSSEQGGHTPDESGSTLDDGGPGEYDEALDESGNPFSDDLLAEIRGKIERKRKLQKELRTTTKEITDLQKRLPEKDRILVKSMQSSDSEADSLLDD